MNVTKQEIKYIQVGLENVEAIDIDVKNIEYMSLSGIADETPVLATILNDDKWVDEARKDIKDARERNWE